MFVHLKTEFQNTNMQNHKKIIDKHKIHRLTLLSE